MLQKRKEYSSLQLGFLDALRDPANRGDLRVCKAVAGYSDNAPIREIIKQLRDEILDISRDILVLHAPKAALTIAAAVDDSTADDMPERTKNAERILDRVGIVRGENLKIDVNVSRIALIPARREE